MPPRPLHLVPWHSPPTHDLSHRSPLINYSGTWLATASHHSWFEDTSGDDGADGARASFDFGFNGTDFAVYGRWAEGSRAAVRVDGGEEGAIVASSLGPASVPARWWRQWRRADEPPQHLLYTESLAPGWHTVSFEMLGGNLDLTKVVVADEPIAAPRDFADVLDAWRTWWLVLVGSGLIYLLLRRRIGRRKLRLHYDGDDDLRADKV